MFGEKRAMTGACGRNAATPECRPISGGVDGDHRNAKPALGFIGDIDNRKIGTGLHDGVDARCREGF